MPLQDLHRAWKRARRQKAPSYNQLRFDATWIRGLLQLQEQLEAGTWSPRPSTCFIATRPKAREIHAPDFADRVAHHAVIPPLDVRYEPAFIHDSYANRVGKGSHAAVRRLQQFVRQVDSGQPAGWFVKMDIHNFFNSISRRILWEDMLKPRMQRWGLPEWLQRAVHALLRNDPLHAGVHVRATPYELAQVPPHKRLANAAPGCGLPIGNLSSQFFANVYLDALDQFVKHQLRAKRYLRYVDDFVIVHHSREQLLEWLGAITEFLGTSLRLSLKPDTQIARLHDGIDFLGYVVRPTHTLCRRRVVAHAIEKLAAIEAIHLRAGRLRATPTQRDRIRSVLASYDGHFQHANTHRLRHRLQARFPWIKDLDR